MIRLLNVNNSLKHLVCGIQHLFDLLGPNIGPHLWSAKALSFPSLKQFKKCPLKNMTCLVHFLQEG